MIEFEISPDVEKLKEKMDDIEKWKVNRDFKKKNLVLQEAVYYYGLTPHDLYQRLRTEFEYKRETRVYIDDRLVITYFSDYPLRFIEHYKKGDGTE